MIGDIDRELNPQNGNIGKKHHVIRHREVLPQDCYDQGQSILDIQNEIGQLERTDETVNNEYDVEEYRGDSIDKKIVDNEINVNEHHHHPHRPEPPKPPSPRHHVWTRISLKVDSEDNWIKSTIPIHDGELAISYEIINGEKTNYRLKSGDCNKVWKDLPFIYDLPYEEYTISSLIPQKGEESRFVLMGKSMNSHNWVEISEEIVIRKFDPSKLYRKINEERNRAIGVENALSDEFKKYQLSGEYTTSSQVSTIVEGYGYATYLSVKDNLSNEGYALKDDIPSYSDISSNIGLSTYTTSREVSAIVERFDYTTYDNVKNKLSSDGYTTSSQVSDIIDDYEFKHLSLSVNGEQKIDYYPNSDENFELNITMSSASDISNALSLSDYLKTRTLSDLSGKWENASNRVDLSSSNWDTAFSRTNEHTSSLTSDAGSLAYKNVDYVGNGKLTIQKNGVEVVSFSANQSGDVTANIVADSPVWGNIAGNIADQTDLQSELTSKVSHQEFDERTWPHAPSIEAEYLQLAGAKSTAEFVNSSINAFAAFYITKNENGDVFDTYAELSSATEFYNAGELRTPTKNDYCIVKEDETKIEPGSVTKPTTRYSYQGEYPTGQWEFQYVVNDTALTQSQLCALNSGINSSLVKKLEGIDDGAEKNVITQISVDGVKLNPVNRGVNIRLSSASEISSSLNLNLYAKITETSSNIQLENEFKKYQLTGEYATSANVSSIVQGYGYTTYLNTKNNLSTDGYALKNNIPSYSEISTGIGLQNYYQKNETSSNTELNEKFNTLSTYAQTKNRLSVDGYLTQHQSLDNYYPKSETSSATQIQDAFNNIPQPNLSDYYQKSETSSNTQLNVRFNGIDSKLSSVSSDVEYYATTIRSWELVED